MTIKSKYTKEFYEHYAKQCLELAYDRKYSNLAKGESPDWQSYELGIGVEITQGISRKKGYTRAVLNDYFGTGYPEEYIPKELQDVDVDDIYLHPYIDMSGRQIRKAYLGKTEKLNKHYATFDVNELFIFAFRSMTEADLYKCFDIDLSKYRVNFDICYINCIDRMYVCDFLSRSILQDIAIPIDKLITIKQSALSQTQYDGMDELCMDILP